jgi:hypothetical protein
MFHVAPAEGTPVAEKVARHQSNDAGHECGDKTLITVTLRAILAVESAHHARLQLRSQCRLSSSA